MANIAKQARDKAQASWGGYSVVERTEKGIKLQHPTDASRFSFDAHIGPIHYGPANENEIDTAWASSQGVWDWEAVLNDIHFFVNDSVPVTYRYLDTASGEQIDIEFDAIEWENDSGQTETVTQFQQVTPTINDDNIRWDGIAPGWNVEVRSQTARLQKRITVNSLAELGTPTLTGTVNLVVRMRFQTSADVFADGVAWTNQKDITNIQALNFGPDFFYMPKPWTIDSGKGSAPVTLNGRKSGQNTWVDVLIPWSWLQSATYPITIDPTIDKQTAASSDDAHQVNAAVTLDATVINLWSAQADEAGARWDSIALDGSETINSASYIDLYIGSFDDLDFLVSFEDADDPGTFTTSNNNISNRTRTTANARWTNAAAGVNAWQKTSDDSADISGAIQEVIDRGGWATNQAMVALFDWQTGDANFFTYDSGTTDGPKLHIDYTAGSSGGTVNAVDGVATADGVVPVVSSGVNITIVDAEATAAGVAPTVTGAANVTAVKGDATATGVPPVVSSGVNVTAVAATASAAGVAPSVSGGASVTAVAGTASAAGVAPVVTSGVNVQAVAGTATATGQPPTVTGGAAGDGEVTAVAGTATASGNAPTITSGSDIAGATGTATASGVAPVLTSGVNVQAVTATATASANPPTVTGEAAGAGEVTAVAGTASAAGQAPVITSGSDIAGAVGQATAAALAPSITVSQTVTAVAATASAAGVAPALTSGVNLQPSAASATATGQAPTVTGVDATAAVVTAIVITATGTMKAPKVTQFDHPFSGGPGSTPKAKPRIPVAVQGGKAIVYRRRNRA